MKKEHVEAIYTLTTAQEGMFYESIQAASSGRYIEQFVCTISGALNCELFEQAWQLVVQRHTALRTGFVWEELQNPLQVVLRKVALIFDQRDWREVPTSEQFKQLEYFLQDERKVGFQLARPPLLRLTLLQTADHSYLFVWTHHHIIMDGWCTTLILGEVWRVYEALCRGKKVQLAPARPYKEYLFWLKGQDFAQAEQFWREELHGVLKPTTFLCPTQILISEQAGKAKSKDTVQTTAPNEVAMPTAHYSETTLTSTTTTAILALVRHQHLTINTFVQGMWALLLSRYSMSKEVLFGMTVSGRPAELPGVEQMVGLFINTLPMRITLPEDEQPWPWLARLQAKNARLRQFEYTSSGQIRLWSDVPGALPLYDSLLVVENYPDQGELNDNTLNIHVTQPRSLGAQTTYALTVIFSIQGGKICIRCIYDPQRIERAVALTVGQQLCILFEYSAARTAEELTLTQLLEIIPPGALPSLSPQWPVEKIAGSGPAAQNACERLLVQIWSRVLGIADIDTEQNFFAVGGHSLTATQLMSRIREEFQIDLPLRTLFQAPTITALAEQIERAQFAQHASAIPPLLPRVADQRPILLSFAQQRLWFLHQLAPGDYSYITPVALNFQGRLQARQLERSLNEIIRRQEALRTTFLLIDGQPMQVVIPEVHLKLPIIDLRALTSIERKQTALKLIREDRTRLFDLQRGPLIRTFLMQLDDDEHILAVIVHHIVFDAWSGGIFISELLTFYSSYCVARPAPLSALPVQYADFALWQRAWLSGSVLAEHLTYWQRQLKNAPPLQLPTDQEQNESAAFIGANAHFSWSQELLQPLVALGQQENTTLFMTLYSTFLVLLMRLTGQQDIVIGTDIANRTQLETEQMIGFFVNLLVLRSTVQPQMSFRQLLRQVRIHILEAYNYQHLPFEKLIEALDLKRNVGQVPLVRALFVLQNAPLTLEAPPGLTIQPFYVEEETAKFDLALFFYQTSNGLQGTINYRSHLFHASTIQSIIQRFSALVGNISAQPDAELETIALLTQQEQVQQHREAKKLLQANRGRLELARRKEIDLAE